MQPTFMIGHAPTVTIGKAPRPTEQQIYEQMWTKPEYRAVAPGETCAQVFLEQAKPKPGSTVIDLGCGTGRGSLMLAALGQLDVTMVDFAENCLDEDIRPMLETQKQSMRFVKADLTKEIPAAAQYGFCTDVLEHIPPENVDKVLRNCLASCQHVFFQISTVDDVCGDLIGHPLHLTVKPYEWWLAKFKELDCAIHWSKELPNACMFYVTAWINGPQMVETGQLNIEEKQAIANVTENIKGDWKQIEPHEANDMEVLIIGGGPSTAEFIEEIKQKKRDGAKIVTLNAAYGWCKENGIGPVTQIMVDARPFNARFVENASAEDMFLLASQCDPSVFAKVPKERTYMWHTSAEMIRDVLVERFGDKWWGIFGGSTVLLRAIPLLRMLGYKKFHLYGCDSCIMDGKHHGYSQPENDEQLAFPVTVHTSGRVFYCNTWMFSQAQEFIDLIKVFGDEIEIQTHGDGLLNHILETAAVDTDILA